MELAALEVPIRATGVSGVRSAFQSVEAAGKQANATLERGAAKTAASAKTAYTRMGQDMVAAIDRTATRGRSTLETRGAELAQSLTRGMRRELIRRQSEIKEELARGFLTPAQAQAQGRAAAEAFNRGVLHVISRQGAAGAFSGRQGGALFVGLAGQLRDVDQAASRAGRGGFRTLASSIASLAAAEIGLRAGLGSMISVLGTLALGAATTLGVVAGLAAIAFAFRQITKDSRDAKERLKEFRAEAEAVAQQQLKASPDYQADQAIAMRALATRRAADALQAQQRADAAALDAERANARQREELLLRAQVLQKAATAARQDALDADRQATALETAYAETRATARAKEADAATAAATEEVRNLVALRDARTATAAELARLADLQRQYQAALTDPTATTAQRAQAQSFLDVIAGAKQSQKSVEEHVRALARLAQSGLATEADLSQLLAIEVSLAAATRTGTAEARAQAQSLLEVVRAARLARLEGAAFGGKMEPRLSKTSPPPFRAFKAAEIPKDGLPTLEMYEVRLKAVAQAFGVTQGQAAGMIAFFDQIETSLDPVNVKLQAMSVVLDAAGQAWSAFWEGVGSGDLSGLGNVIAGFAKQMSQLFAAQAMGALAMGLTPPPLGNPAMLAAVPRLLAASAAFGLLAGVAGGGRGGSGGGYGDYRTTRERDDYREFSVMPRLRPAGASATAGAAHRVSPAQPVVINQTIIGERDPAAQRQIARLTENAARRGYKVGA